MKKNCVMGDVWGCAVALGASRVGTTDAADRTAAGCGPGQHQDLSHLPRQRSQGHSDPPQQDGGDGRSAHALRARWLRRLPRRQQEARRDAAALPGHRVQRPARLARREAERGLPELSRKRPADELEGQPDAAGGLACTDCHTAHSAKDPILVRSTQPQKCFTCHARQRAESYEYSHHPIREGKVVCSDCHNPHGSPGDTKLLKEFTVNQTCYTCHADKRGPMLWEHQPVRENCTELPHPAWLQPAAPAERTAELPLLLLPQRTGQQQRRRVRRCALDPVRARAAAAFFNSALANQRTCVNCHSQVHGSNSPNGAFFLR